MSEMPGRNDGVPDGEDFSSWDPLIEGLREIHDLVYQQAAAKALDVLASSNPSERELEGAFEALLDCTMTERGLAAFRFLCGHYFKSHPLLVAEYIRDYKELYVDGEQGGVAAWK